MADYDVVLLIEQALSAADAAQVRSLHEAIEDPVTYHVLLPVDDAAGQVEAGMGPLMAGDPFASPGLASIGVDLEALQEEHDKEAAAELRQTRDALITAGARVGSALLTTGSPIEALTSKIADVDGREAIILTRPHVIAEFFHVDWSSQARRAIGVPVLHLVEHENFDEQAGGGEGVFGL